MKLSFWCLWSQTSDIWYIFLCSSFETTPSTEGAILFCLFLLLLLICGKTVLEPVVLGTIKHWPSKLHPPRSQNKTAGETHPGTTEAAGFTMTSTDSSSLAVPTLSLITDGPGPWKMLCMCRTLHIQGDHWACWSPGHTLWFSHREHLPRSGPVNAEKCRKSPQSLHDL